MKRSLAWTCFLIALSVSLLQIGCGASSSLPPSERLSISGIYEGTVRSKENDLPVRLVIGKLNASGQFNCKLYDPINEELAPSTGRGSVFGTSISMVFEETTSSVFYIQGEYFAEGKLIRGTVTFPEEERSLEIIVIFKQLLPEGKQD